MMFFDIIASGSKGNATLLFSGENIFLIDFGITNKRLEEELQLFGKSIKDIDALFVTHEHADHIKGTKAISPKETIRFVGNSSFFSKCP